MYQGTHLEMTSNESGLVKWRKMEQEALAFQQGERHRQQNPDQ